MNIFYLDDDPIKSARAHVDKHVVKMPVETAQMLSTTLREMGVNAPDEGTDKLYQVSYAWHPCTKWVGRSYENFRWTCKFGLALCHEYTHRYGRFHAAEQVFSTIIKLVDSVPISAWPEIGITERPKCVAPEFKQYDPVTAYRLQYLAKKTRLFHWTNRPMPKWIEDTSWTKEV
jgi:hypothetical protein